MTHKTEFLYLSEQDTIKAGVLNAEKCIDNAQEVFTLLSKGDYLMGGSNHNSHGLWTGFPKRESFSKYACSRSGQKVCGYACISGRKI